MAKRRRRKYRGRPRKSLKGMTAAQKRAHRLKVRREWYHKRLKPLRKRLRKWIAKARARRLNGLH